MLETERLILRRFTLDDLDELVRLRVDPEVGRYLGEQSREKVEQRLRFYISHYEPHGFGVWAVILKDTGRMIGWCGLMFLEETPEVEVGYGVAREYWGQGLMTEAARACLRYGFETAGLERIVAVAMPENLASRRVMEKLGMRYEKMAHHYGHELVYYAIGRDEFKANDAFHLSRDEK